MFIEICEKGVKGLAIIFVTGGAKSGKSKFAEEMLLKLNNGKQENIYLATSIVFYEEIK